MKKISILFICLLITVWHVAAQVKPPTITVEFKDVRIQDFVKEIESKTKYHFYYNPAEFDSVRVTLSAKNESVSSILRLAFRNTNFSYTIDPNNNVFLSKGVEILASLPYGLFENEKDSLSWQMQKEPELIAELTTTVQENQISSQEGKQIQIGNKTAQLRPGNVTLVGYVRDAKTGAPEIGAAVFVESPRISTYTNQFGYYTLVIPRGPHTLNIKALGIQDTKRNLMIYSDGKLDVEIQTQVLSLREVVISAEKSANVRNVQMGVEKLSISSIKQVPVAFGEADIVKVMLTLPGVKSVGEASNGFNVRGGAVDQNLILFDDLTIYNPSHFFGFFSAFNPDVIKDVELYKSSIPSRYGGRLSSVLDVNSRDGNTKKLSGTAGIGLLTGRLSIEGPIIKDKTSFILGGRTTYSNWLLKMLPENSGYKDAKASFSDLNLRISHEDQQ
jgi:hypothetical protein